MASERSSPSSLLYPYIKRENGPEEEEDLEEDEDIIFCSEENVSEAAAYINQELEVLGFQSILSEKGGGQEEPSLIKLINVMYDFIKQYRVSMNRSDNMNMSLQRTRSDLTLQFEANTRLKAELEELERKLAQTREKERQVLARNRSLSLQLKSQEEECHKLQHRMSQKELQYEHELRKKEREYHRLNERLGQLVLNKNQEKKLGIKILNTLQATTSRGGGKGGGGGTEITVPCRDIRAYKLVISHYEEKQKELMLENSSLRDSLCNMEKELVTLLNYKYFTSLSSPAPSNISKVEGAELSPEREELLDSGHYQMPYDIVRQDIEENLRDKYDRLREYIVSLKKGHTSSLSSSKSYDKEIEDLEKKLADYRDIISQQELMLEKQLEESQSDPSVGLLNESKHLKKEEMLQLREEKNRHYEEHLKSEEERLGLQARQLDRERRDFEDRKATFLMQQLDSSVFATPNKATSELDSFFLRLNSTPFSLSTRKPHSSYSRTKLSNNSTRGAPPHSILKTPYRPARSSSSEQKPFATPPPVTTFSPAVHKSTTTPFKSQVSGSTDSVSDNGAAGPNIDLKQDISLTSDDGLEVLND